jgi:hypothetical protein
MVELKDSKYNKSNKIPQSNNTKYIDPNKTIIIFNGVCLKGFYTIYY